METQERCSRCVSEKNVIGISFVYADPRFVAKHQAMYHIFCLGCGNLIRSYIKRPEMFIGK